MTKRDRKNGNVRGLDAEEGFRVRQLEPGSRQAYRTRAEPVRDGAEHYVLGGQTAIFSILFGAWIAASMSRSIVLRSTGSPVYARMARRM
jgi:hypothetical protein